MEHVSGKQAQLMLEITTRQGLHKFVREHNLEIKGQGIGKPNLYLKEQIEELAKLVVNKRKKPKAIKKKIEKKKEIILANKQEVEEVKTKDMLNENPLNEVDQEVFNELRQQLIENGTYQEKDISLLQAYCVSYQKYINAINQSAENLDITMDDIGNIKIHPYFQIADKSLSQMIKIGNILGIGARSRTGLNIKQPKKDSVFDALKVEEFN